MIYKKERWEKHLYMLAQSFSFTPAMYSPMEKLYSKHTSYFDTYAQKNPYYDSSRMISRPIRDEIRLKKMLGIVMAGEEDDEVLSQILCAMKKAYPIAYNTFKSNDFDLYKEFLHQVKKMSDEQWDSRVFEGVSEYLFTKLSENSISNMDEEFATGPYIRGNRLLLERIECERDAIEGEKMNLPLTDENLDEQSRLFSSVCDDRRKYSLLRATMVDAFAGYVPSKDVMYRKKRGLDMWKKLDKIKGTQLIAEAIQSSSGLCTVFEAAGFEFDNFMAHISPQIPKSVHRAIVNSSIKGPEVLRHQNRNEPIMSGYAYMIYMSLYYVLREYKSLRTDYLRSSSEAMKAEIDSLQGVIRQNERLIQQERAQAEALKRENELLRNAKIQNVQSRTQDIIRIEKQYGDIISELKGEISQLRSEHEELAHLRELFFELENPFVEQDVSTFDINAFCEKYHVAILGGHERLQNRIRAEVPEVELFDGINKNLEIEKHLETMDYVFLYTGHMSHSVYYTAMDCIRKNNIPFSYLTGTNMAVVKSSMSSALSKFEKEKLNDV